MGEAKKNKRSTKGGLSKMKVEILMNRLDELRARADKLAGDIEFAVHIIKGITDQRERSKGIEAS